MILFIREIRGNIYYFTLWVLSMYKPIGASPRRYHEDGISRNRLGVRNGYYEEGNSRNRIGVRNDT